MNKRKIDSITVRLVEEAEENAVSDSALDDLVLATALKKLKVNNSHAGLIRFLLENGVTEDVIHDTMVENQFH